MPTIAERREPDEDVALHPEGVDRNTYCLDNMPHLGLSPSTRRAWIEISSAVDAIYIKKSPSTRRAWIEMGSGQTTKCGGGVALHSEGVDRNV